MSNLLAVDESLLDPAMDCYKILYKALNIYVHSQATPTNRACAMRCRCLNYGMPTLEVCKVLSKNRPPGIAVQALSSQWPPMLQTLFSLLTLQRVVVDEEEEVLMLNLRRMRGRLVELETTHKVMRGQTKVSRATDKGAS